MFDSFKAKVQQQRSKTSPGPSPAASGKYSAVASVITPLKGMEEESEVPTPLGIGGVGKLTVQKLSHLLLLGIGFLCCVNGVLLVRQLRFAAFLLGITNVVIGCLISAVELFQNLTETVNEQFKLWNSVTGRACTLLFICLVTLNQPTQHLSRLVSLVQFIATLGWWGLLLFSSSEIPAAIFHLNFPLFNGGSDNSPAIYLSAEKY